MPVFGPGTLKIGAVATQVDVSCLVNSLRIASTVDAGDATYKLCGTSKPGARKYSWEMTGNVDIDPSDAAGLFQLSQESYGTEQDFEYVPNTADGTTAIGKLIIDPLDFGADAYGDDMTSDLTWALVDKPTYTYGTDVVGDGAAAQDAPVVVDEPAPTPTGRKAKASV